MNQLDVNDLPFDHDAGAGGDGVMTLRAQRPRSGRRAIAAILVGLGLAPAPAAATTLTIMQSEPPRSMDPADHTATFTASVLDPVYEGLVEMDPDGRISPLLATGWTGSADGLDWRFALRPGVRFHDGTPFDAQAAAASFQRLLSPARGLAGAGRFRAVIASVAADGDALLIRLHRPYAFLLPLLAAPQAEIVSPAADRAGTLGRQADGTGPYRFVRWDAGEDVVEARDPGWWGASQVLPGQPDRLRWTWSSEASVMNMALRSGDVQAAVPFAPLFGRLALEDPALRIDRNDGAAVYFVALNTRLPPLDDARVRRALSLATDRDGLVAALLHGFGTPACSPLPPALAGCGTARPALAFDLAAARALLSQAGVPHGFTLSVAVQEPEEPIAEALQAMWAELGVRLQIRRLESGVWAEAAFAGPQAKADSRLGAVITSWASPFLPDVELDALFASGSAAPHGANLSFFVDPVLDREIAAAAATLAPAARGMRYGAVQDRLVAEMPDILLYTRADLLGRRRQVSGIALMPGGELHLDRVRLTAE